MESRDELFEAAEEMGEELTEWKLRDWRSRRNLLPKPVYREGHGRGGEGSTTYYPDGTARALKWLIYFKRRAPNLDVVGWNLWGMGYPVVGFVQEKFPKYLKERADKVNEELEAYEEGDLNSSIYSAFSLSLSRMVDNIRRRIPEGQFSRFIRFNIELYSGDVSPDLLYQTPTILDLLNRGLPIDLDWDNKELDLGVDLMSELYDLEANLRAAEKVTEEEHLKCQEEVMWGWRHITEEAGVESPCPFQPLVYAFWFAIRARDTRAGRIVEEQRQSRRWQAMMRLADRQRRHDDE